MLACTRVCAAVTVTLLLFPFAPADDRPPQLLPKSPDGGPKPRGVRVIKLERADPAEVKLTLGSLLPAREVVEPPVFARPATEPGPAVVFNKADVVTRFQSELIAVPDERTGALVVRGPEHLVQVAADLAAVLDRKDGDPVPPLKALKAFAPKHAPASDLARIIDSLELDDVRAVAVGKVLLVLAPDDAAKAVADVVKDLDVPGKPAAKDAPKE